MLKGFRFYSIYSRGTGGEMGQIHTWQKMREAEDEGQGKSYTTSAAFTAGLSEHPKAPSSNVDHEEKTTQWGSQHSGDLTVAWKRNHHFQTRKAEGE